MAYKIQIIDNALQVSDTMSGDVLIDPPSNGVWYKVESLSNGYIKFFGTTWMNERTLNEYKNTDFVGFPIGECVDVNDTTFTAETFRAFCYENLSFSSASGSGANGQAIARSLVTQTLLIHNGLEATETVINFGDEETDDWKIVGGVVEVKTVIEEVACGIEIHLIKVGAQNAEFDCWLEASADGVAWTAIDESLRREVIDKDGSTTVLADFSFNVSLPLGGMFRIIATNNGANTLSMQKPSDIVTANGGATGFAKKIRLVKIK